MLSCCAFFAVAAYRRRTKKKKNGEEEPTALERDDAADTATLSSFVSSVLTRARKLMALECLDKALARSGVDGAAVAPAGSEDQASLPPAYRPKASSSLPKTPPSGWYKTDEIWPPKSSGTSPGGDIMESPLSGT